MTDRLLVLVSEHVSEWIAKGEVVERYYNPGNRFAEVHLLLTNDDQVDGSAVQRLVGTARPFVHHLPIDRRLFARSLGWRPRLLRSWAAAAVEIARDVDPALVRCHGAHLNGLCALEIRRRLGIPYVVSLHTLPTDPVHPTSSWLWPRLEDVAIRSVRSATVRGADAVIAVYESLVPYLQHLGARRVVVIHNVLNGDALRVKERYAVAGAPHAITVGRLIRGKDPRDVIDAVASIDGLRLKIVGDGPLRKAVEAHVATLGLEGRVEIAPALPNDELVSSLADFDLFVARNDYDGVPKAVLEPLLAGLPTVVNRPPAVAELSDEVVLAVAPTADGFRDGLRRLLDDEQLRERLGRSARVWAAREIDPRRLEERVVELYDELIRAR
jgi:glycosyltransferase involved in cell wall biosynthesis